MPQLARNATVDPVHKDRDPSLYPCEKAVEYTRALNAVKLDRVLSLPAAQRMRLNQVLKAPVKLEPGTEVAAAALVSAAQVFQALAVQERQLLCTSSNPCCSR
ncbi:g1026 [Coccomyxa viridis]|uniref:G1026 protein n=1 Tax=Coccomyxa viridis TaxID=1274662 RepID=A0ABP1FMG8_9CHLO